VSKDGAMSTKEYYKRLLDRDEDIFREITRFSEKEAEVFDALLKHLEKVNSERDQFSNEEKGKALETAVSFLLENITIFKVREHLFTSTNEMDQLITLSFKGEKFREHIDIRGEFFICECKNHAVKIGVTWVGKFYSLLSCHCNLGIIFSYNGLAGSGWEDGVGLTKKLFLNKEDHAKRSYILDFNMKDLKLISKGHSFIELLNAKMIALKTDSSYEEHITLHPAQESGSNDDAS